jgi:hypothetical protein
MQIQTLPAAALRSQAAEAMTLARISQANGHTAQAVAFRAEAAELVTLAALAARVELVAA